MQSQIAFERYLLPSYRKEPSVKKKRGIKFVWKPPIWLDEDKGKETGIKQENVSFAVFDTLIRRSVAQHADCFASWSRTARTCLSTLLKSE